MIVILNLLSGNEPANIVSDDDRPSENYFKVREEEDYFPDTSLSVPVGITQHDDTEVEMQKMVKRASDNGLTDDGTRKLSELVQIFK